MQKKEKGTRSKPSLKQKFFHRPNRRRSRTSQQSSSGGAMQPQETERITKISSAIRAITSIFRKRKGKLPICTVINEEPSSSNGKKTSVDVLNINTRLESKSVSDADVTFADKDVDTSLDLYFFEGSESKTVLVATTQISSSDWTELIKILSSERNVKYLASKGRALENQCELELLESKNSDKQMALDVVTQYSLQTLENKAIDTSLYDFFIDNKGKIHNLEMTQNETVSVTPTKYASTQDESFISRGLLMKLSMAIQTEPCNLSLLNDNRILKPKDAYTETHHYQYERTKNDFTATTELNECSSSFEEYKRKLKHTGTECYINDSISSYNNKISTMNLVYRLDCINRDAIGDNVYLLPVTKSFRKKINEALDLLKSSEDKLRNLNNIKEHHQTRKHDDRERLTTPSEYFSSLKNMSEEFRNVTSKIASRYLEEYGERYDDLEDYNYYLMKPRAFDILSKIEGNDFLDDPEVIADDEETDNILHKEIVTLEKLIEEITNLENKIKERDCQYQDLSLIHEHNSFNNRATNSEPESLIKVVNCQLSKEASKSLKTPNREREDVANRVNNEMLYAYSDSMSKENRMYQQRQFSNSTSMPNFSKEEVDRTIRLLETTRKDLMKFVCNDRKYKQSNKFPTKYQTIDCPPQEKRCDGVLNCPQNKTLKADKKNTHVTETCCFYEDHSVAQTIGDEIYKDNSNCVKIDTINKEFLEHYTQQKLEILETLTNAISDLKNSFDGQFSLLKSQNSPPSSSCSNNRSEGFIRNIVSDMISSISNTKRTITHNDTQTDPTESSKIHSLHSKETLGHVIIEEMIVDDSHNNKQTQISIETTSEREISTKNTNFEDSPILSCNTKYVDSLEDLAAEFDRSRRNAKVFALNCLQMPIPSTSKKIFSDEDRTVFNAVANNSSFLL